MRVCAHFGLSIMQKADEGYYVTLPFQDGWSAHVTQEGRVFYCNHATQTSSWLPPCDNWNSKKAGLPYGWEIAVDKDSKQYFINHLNKTTTYEDPRKDFVEDSPKPREVELIRHPEMGFGFIAGSEKPVIVRHVTEGGPSHGKLLPGDQILKVNGEDVKTTPRDHAIDLVKTCKHSVILTVCQPETYSSSRKSALLSASKKARLKSNPSRVRFAEGVVINGSPLFSPSNYSTESCVPFMPNVLKVFLENGQTKSFKYDNTTLVQDVLESLQQKLSIKCIEHFSLVVEHIKSLRRNKLTLLDPKECLAKVAARPGAQHLRCLFRVTFVPKDSYDLLKEDPVTFEYLYTQCCNDVVQERFAPELKYDIALRLAALHMQQYYLSNISTSSLSLSTTTQTKLSIKTIERECGLDYFVPVSLTETMKRKELRKLLSHFLKLNQGLSAPGQKTLTALQAKLHYLRIISELPSYGAKCFTTNLRDSNMETVILVSPKFGISQITGMRNTMPMTLANIEDLEAIVINREDDVSHQVELQMKDMAAQNILLSLEDRESEELVLLLQGYYRLLTNRPLPVQQEKDRWADDGAPPYHGKHSVHEAGWNYVPSGTPLASATATDNSSDEAQRTVDLSLGPPAYQLKNATANGHLSHAPTPATDNQTDKKSASSSAAVVNHFDQQNNAVDKNMNRTLSYQPLERNVSVGVREASSSVSKAVTTDAVCLTSESAITSTCSSFIAKQNSTGVLSSNDGKRMVLLSSVAPQFHHVLQMEIRDGSGVAKADDRDKAAGDEMQMEAERKNADVLKRVAEMQQIVLDAEMYLTEEDATDTESRAESSHGDSQDRALKAADSLLLLNQIGRESEIEEAVKSIHIIDHEPSESDTDSMSTPTDSPSHRPTVDRRLLRPHHPPVVRSGSSFGLHSPDNFHKDVRLEKTNLHQLFQKLQDSQLPYPFAEGTLYLDPDIIDLTMIPPPITPDHEEAPSAVSFPPTPFADRQTLEAELAHGLIPFNHGAKTAFNLLHNNMYALSRMGYGNVMRNISSGTEESGNGSNWVANEDIDKFIASVAVPPPPTTAEQQQQSEPYGYKDVTELTQEEISAYIIPPPPASSSSDSETEMISRLQSAAASVEEIVKKKKLINSRCHKDAETDDSNGTDLSLTNAEMVTLNVSYEGNGFNDILCSDTGKGDSSGYETYSSSAVSSMELKPSHRRTLNNSFSDNSSTISCSSSSTTTTTTEMAGSQADTEDNAIDVEDYSCSRSPLLTLPPKATSGGRTSNGTQQLANGLLKSGVRSAAVRCYSGSSSDDGLSPNNNINNNNNNNNGVTTTPRRTGIPCHQSSNSSSLSRKKPSSAAVRLNGNARSSSTDNLSKGAVSSESAETKALNEQWATSSECLASAAAATDRRNNGGATPKSPTSPTLCKSSPNKKITGRSAGNEETNNKTGLKPIAAVKHMSNGAQKSLISGTVQEGAIQQEQDRLKEMDGFLNDKVSSYSKKRSTSLKLSSRKLVSSSESLSTENMRHTTSRIRLNTLTKSDSNVNNNLKNSCDVNKSQLPISKLPRGCSSNLKHSESSVCGDVPPPDKAQQPQLYNSSHQYLSSLRSSSSFRHRTLEKQRCEDSSKYESASKSLVCHRDRRDSFYGAEEAIGNMLIKLDQVLTHYCAGKSQNQASVQLLIGTACDLKVNAAKEALVSASKQFVTASKLFVKGATESEERLVECLVQCLGLLDQMFVNTERLALISNMPLQMHDLVLKVKDVAFTFLQTLQAASQAVGKNMSNPSVNLLMQQATILAAVLTALMRTLRVFNH